MDAWAELQELYGRGKYPSNNAKELRGDLNGIRQSVAQNRVTWLNPMAGQGCHIVRRLFVMNSEGEIHEESNDRYATQNQERGNVVS